MSARCLFFLPLVMVAALAAEGPGPVAPATRVQAAAVVRSSRAIPVRVPGVVARRAEWALAFKIGGLVREVNVRAGDRVAAGQVLASLDLAEIDAELARAQSSLDKARRDRDRASELRERNVISIEQVQNAETGLELAEAALRIADFNRRHAVVAAPAAGRVLRRQVEPNDMVSPGKVAILMASEEEGWIARAGLPEAGAARLQVGDAARIDAAGHPPMTGEVVQISEAADPLTRTVEIEVRLARAPEALRSGSVVDLEIQPGDVAARAVVPVSALVEGDGRLAHVFLLSADGRTVQRMKVTVAAIDAGQAFLATELPAGVRVVTSGAEFLRDGAAVEIAP